MNKNHEKELLENTVKRFVEEELYPHEETVDKNGNQKFEKDEDSLISKEII